MTSPGQVPNPAVLARPADDGQPAIDAIAEAVAGLDDVQELPVAEHVERFEAVHAALTDALSKADHLSSGTNAHRS
ncbi:hypothetical protein [Saccharopolyspora hordei]|uniref:Uncharacterized protein n=1 Tax=Saccharopolyspora hordei TaxID=1838 RepID=A0A853ASU0_9PSEU|nr:hypothetical protein [Saccharopolyspora hordei]NYI85397.1 hypothetical protein [Saccharopolyspora hordei]